MSNHPIEIDNNPGKRNRQRSIPGAIWHYLKDPRELLAARIMLAAGPVFLADTILAPVSVVFPPLTAFLLANEWVWFLFLVFYFSRKIYEHQFLD